MYEGDLQQVLQFWFQGSIRRKQLLVFQSGWQSFGNTSDEISSEQTALTWVHVLIWFVMTAPSSSLPLLQGWGLGELRKHGKLSSIYFYFYFRMWLFCSLCSCYQNGIAFFFFLLQHVKLCESSRGYVVTSLFSALRFHLSMLSKVLCFGLVCFFVCFFQKWRFSYFSVELYVVFLN